MPVVPMAEQPGSASSTPSRQRQELAPTRDDGGCEALSPRSRKTPRRNDAGAVSLVERDRTVSSVSFTRLIDGC